MDVRQKIVREIKDDSDKFMDVAFNQDESCFSCATNDGFVVYNTYPLSLKLSKSFKSTPERGGGIGHTQMLYRTNYIALIGGGNRPRYSLNRLVVWDDLQQKESISLKFMSVVRKVLLSRVHILVCLENELFIYNFSSNPKLLCPPIKIYPFGSIDFKVVTTNNAKVTGLVAYPSAKTTGQLHLADLSKLKANPDNSSSVVDNFLPTTIIKAHRGPIRLVKINNQGTMVATCSNKGTLIRIFSTHNGTLIREFRRGLDRADIYDMSFSPHGTRLAVVSDKQTLHIFQVLPISDVPAVENVVHDNGNSVGRASLSPVPLQRQSPKTNQVHSLRNLVPQQWKPRYLDSVWSMCKIHLKNPRIRNNINDFEFSEDRCRIAWCRDRRRKSNSSFSEDEENSFIVVWKNSRIWEKYVILEKEIEPKSTANSSPSPIVQWEILRESWREL
ncbi:phosphatidylinositol-3,5-bisphosphate binding protein HSV2 [Nakaseomyces bracarensis]|uniref:phosphatidylinositol-3,5-bisphosphate binding protein HSV2 n=1 Tax=Nakaseomyces bracarensis TaxID=273131 RepID=UPI00387297AC